MLLRSLNENQRLILVSSARNYAGTITSILKDLCERDGVPLATLKLNASILRSIGLITYGEERPAKATPLGAFVLSVIYNNCVGDNVNEAVSEGESYA